MAEPSLRRKQLVIAALEEAKAEEEMSQTQSTARGKDLKMSEEGKKALAEYLKKTGQFKQPAEEKSLDIKQKKQP